MTLYVDSSALIKRYVEEPDCETAERYLRGDPVWVTGRHTSVEVRRNLARLLARRGLAEARREFERDWARFGIIEIDAETCSIASEIAELVGARTLDALHLAAATRVGVSAMTFLTFDIRQAECARGGAEVVRMV